MIRLYSKSDLLPLHRMICDTIEASYSGVYPSRAVEFFKAHHSEKRIEERSTLGEILIIEKDGEILATGSLVDAEILGVFVRPDCRRKGYGKAIVTELERRAGSNGFYRVTLSISLPSRSFYESLGYKVFAERGVEVGEGQRLHYWPGEKELRNEE